MQPRASVLVPTHDQPRTLPLTVDTVLRQTVPELEVLLIGDGVTPRARPVIEELVRLDARVRFLDFPKGPHHGERYRHDAIAEARSDALFYLCDDDLLLPNHVEDLLALLEDHDLVQSRNGFVTHEGEIRCFADDLADPQSREMHLREWPRFNSISITGTAHSRLIYDKVDDPWDTTPSGWNPDHYQFRKLLMEPSCRAATSARMTALQFPTNAGRQTWTAEERAAEILPWHELVGTPGAQAEIDRRYVEGALSQLVEERRARIVLRQRHHAAESRVREQEQKLAALRARVSKLRGRLRAQRDRQLRRRLARRLEWWNRSVSLFHHDRPAR